MAPRGGTIADLKAGCRAFREQLLAGRLATPEELAPYWPGGAQNGFRPGTKGPGLKNWIRCYTVYGGFARRVEWRHAKADTISTPAKRQIVLDAIGEVPEVVELLGMDPATGHRRTLTVYQKGDLALKEVHKANGDLAICVEQYDAHVKRDTIEGWEAAKRWLDELTYLQRLIVWIVTSPGPGLPYPEGQLCPTLPVEYSQMSPVDFYGIAQAFQRVNILPLTVLESSIAPKTRADWATFWTAVEFELHTPVPTLRRDRGLAGLIIATHEHARATQEAQERAAADAKTQAPPPGAMAAGGVRT